MARTPRPAREHKITAEEAGLSRISWLSLLAGTVSAYGAFAIVAAIAGSVLAAADVDTEFRTSDWTSSGAVAGLVSGLVLLAAYMFGGYVAGRMARRAGLLHGLGVALLSLVLGGIVGAIAGVAQDSGSIQDDLSGIGVPTDWDQVRGVAIFSVALALVAIVVGGILGGILGERWHTRLARRVEDPNRGPAAAARDQADRDRERAAELDRDRDERRHADTTMVREAEHRQRHDRDGDGRDDRAEPDTIPPMSPAPSAYPGAPTAAPAAPVAADLREGGATPVEPRPGWPGAGAGETHVPHHAGRHR